MSGAIATIDVGTNTTLMLVARAREAGAAPEVLAERAEITRLGRGIGRSAASGQIDNGQSGESRKTGEASAGRLGSEGIARTLAVLSDYAETARAHQAAVVAVGTEGLRRAANASDFLGPAARILGVPVEIIDGEREAALAFLAAARSFPAEAAQAMWVVDIGGGSTEIISARAGKMITRKSLPIGSVRLTERCLRHDPPTPTELASLRSEIRGALDGIPLPIRPAAEPAPALVGTAGTVTTVTSMSLGLVRYDAALVQGHRLTTAALRAQIARLETSTQAQREMMIGLDPRRADVILAGACILEEVAAVVGVDHLIVNDRGIRWGLLYERLG
jgi:exopolyphosphatase/guanosine-5'-triphosphate,3'-diphosphate pyrophosphatase